MTSRKPGWYPVEGDPGSIRYWDGSTFTQIAPKPPAAPEFGVLHIARGVALGTLIAGAILWLLAQFGGAIAAEDAREDAAYREELIRTCEEARAVGVPESELTDCP